MKISKNFDQYKDSINTILSKISQNYINQTIKIIKNTILKKGTIYIVGNGGSASIASHVSVDFAKAARIKSSTFTSS